MELIFLICTIISPLHITEDDTKGTDDHFFPNEFFNTLFIYSRSCISNVNATHYNSPQKT